MTDPEEFVHLAVPSIGETEIDAVVEVLRSGWLTTGSRVAALEKGVASMVGAEAGLAVSSATAALHVALLAEGIGPGDAVAVSPLTFCSAIHVVEHVGARPVFVDVDTDTLCMSPEALAQVADSTPDLRAVQPVHLHGHPADVGAIGSISERHDLRVVADGAHGLGAATEGAQVGSAGEFGNVAATTSFSFYATKNLTTAEGGMLVGPADVINRASRWILHGMTADAFRRNTSEGRWRYDVVEAGFKYNLSDLAAALGVAQLSRFGDMQSRRAQLVKLYRRLGEVEELELPTQRAGTTHAWHIYAIRLHLDRLRIDRSAFVQALRDAGVGASVHFIPVPLFSYYRDRYPDAAAGVPVALREWERMVSLPMHPGMTDAEAERVVDACAAICAAHRL